MRKLKKPETLTNAIYNKGFNSMQSVVVRISLLHIVSTVIVYAKKQKNKFI